MLDAFGVDPRDYDRAPPPIDPICLPPGPLNRDAYRAVVSRNRYLAGKYDPESLTDRALNLVTGAMHDPKRILTDAERVEHRALSAKIAETLNPSPTPDGARLEAMEASPLGAIASLAAREAGGGQAAQDLALNLGTAADGLGLAMAGARAGPATRFLGAQAGEAVPVVQEKQPLLALAALPAPESPASPPTAEEQVKVLRGHGDARHGTATTTAQQTTRVLTGVAPDGRKAPTPRATRFDSPEAQLDAVNRALQRTQARDAAGLISHTIKSDSQGTLFLPRDTSVVTGLPGGYGSGVQRQKAAPGVAPTILPTSQDMNALVILERDPQTGIWYTVTQYPSNKPSTP